MFKWTFFGISLDEISLVQIDLLQNALGQIYFFQITICQMTFLRITIVFELVLEKSLIHNVFCVSLIPVGILFSKSLLFSPTPVPLDSIFTLEFDERPWGSF